MTLKFGYNLGFINPFFMERQLHVMLSPGINDNVISKVLYKKLIMNN